MTINTNSLSFVLDDTTGVLTISGTGSNLPTSLGIAFPTDSNGVAPRVRLNSGQPMSAGIYPITGSSVTSSVSGSNFTLNLPLNSAGKAPLGVDHPAGDGDLSITLTASGGLDFPLLNFMIALATP